jgi:hypothetical protein
MDSLLQATDGGEHYALVEAAARNGDGEQPYRVARQLATQADDLPSAPWQLRAVLRHCGDLGVEHRLHSTASNEIPTSTSLSALVAH